jgi:hypothetical protein
MMRFIVSVLATVAIFLAATAAQAVLNVSVVGTNLTTLSGDLSLAVDGDQVQVDIFIENVGSAVAGATLTAFGTTFGVGSDTLNWDGGESAGFYFNTVNAKTSLALPRTLSNADIQAGVIRFFSGLSPTTPATGDASVDLGIKDGTNAPFVSPNVDLTGNGAAHARLIFTVVGAGAVLELGDDGLIGGLTDANAPGSVGTINNASIQIGAVPEPGTALLMGLGLSGLSLAGRRRA